MLEEKLMQSGNQTAPISKKMLWTGRIISGLPALFLLLDGIMKLIKPAPVVEATVQLGYPESAILGLGIVLIASTLLISDSAYLNSWRNPADRLSGRRRRYSCARRRQPVFSSLSCLFWPADLGRTLLAR